MKKKNSITKDKAYFALIWLFILGLIISIFYNVQMYYDDYGYYSLVYGVGGDGYKLGQYGLLELFHFLIEHYKMANGRILYFFVWLFFFMIGGLKAVDIVAAIDVCIVLFLLWKMAAKRGYSLAIKIFLAILVFSLYASLQMGLVNNSIYWMAAHFHYVMPMIPFLAFLIKYDIYEGCLSGKDKLISVVLVFLTSFSMESWSIAIFITMIVLSIYEMKAFHRKWFISLVFASGVGTAILGLSPGIWNRYSNIPQEYLESSYYERILHNLKGCVTTLYDYTLLGNYHMFFSLIIVAMCAYMYVKEKKIRLKFIHGIIGIGAIVVFVLFTFYKSRIQTIIASDSAKGLLTVYTIFVAVEILFFYGRYIQNLSRMILAFAGEMSIAVLMIVYDKPARVFLFWIWISLLISLDVVVEIINNKHKKNIFMLIILSVAILFAIPNYKSLWQGYKQNKDIAMENDNILKNCESDSYVLLRKMVAPGYSGQMLYDGGTFMKYYMAAYYGIDAFEKPFVYYDGTTTVNELDVKDNEITIAYHKNNLKKIKGEIWCDSSLQGKIIIEVNGVVKLEKDIVEGTNEINVKKIVETDDTDINVKIYCSNNNGEKEKFKLWYIEL